MAIINSSGDTNLSGNGRVFFDNAANPGGGLGKFLGSFTGAQNCDFNVDAGNNECGILFALFQNNPDSVTNSFKFDVWNIGCNSNGTLHSNNRTLINSNLGGTGSIPAYNFTILSGSNIKTLRIAPTGNITTYLVYYLKIR